MILKSLTRKSGSDQLLRYIFRYLLNPEKQEQAQEPFIIKHNIRSRDIQGFVREFKENETHRLHTRKDQTAIHHTILSWSDNDRVHITPEKLRAIVKHFIKIRGDNNLYLGTIHTDRHHTHLHIAMSGSQLNGRSSRISKEAFAEVKFSLDAFQKEHYPELSHSLPMHGRKKEVQQSTPAIDKRNNRTTEKEKLLQAIEEAYVNAQSLESFLITLKELGHEAYYRAGQLTGIQLENGRKFRFRTLGYDKAKLSVLATRCAETDILTELKDLRSKSNERTQEHSIQKNIATTEPTYLNEFEMLRLASRGVRGLVLEK